MIVKPNWQHNLHTATFSCQGNQREAQICAVTWRRPGAQCALTKSDLVNPDLYHAVSENIFHTLPTESFLFCNTLPHPPRNSSLTWVHSYFDFKTPPPLEVIIIILFKILFFIIIFVCVLHYPPWMAFAKRGLSVQLIVVKNDFNKWMNELLEVNVQCFINRADKTFWPPQRDSSVDVLSIKGAQSALGPRWPGR